MSAELYNELIEKIRKYHPSGDFAMIEKAYMLAKEAHKDQKRKSGEPYIIHPLCVAIILAELELDKESIVAGILHDCVEDTIMTTEDISKEFSPEIALLVDGVTKLKKIPFDYDKVEIQAENYRKMFLAMAKDIRVIIIKLADRLHNLRTLEYMSEQKRYEKAKETMDIYAPIANRLGISKIKVELDDLAFRYIYPNEYYDLVEKIAKKRSERIEYVEKLVTEIEIQLDLAGISARVEGRPKHFFSIYKKMVSHSKTLDQIYDLFAVRIIVENVKDCYGALGIIHEMYKPIPGRFKDYIAMPKSNMYQSLHTTLMGTEGMPFEIQIRTLEMHRTADYGIAAHWKYKEQSTTGTTVAESEQKKLSWLREILEWQKDLSDNKEFVNLLKTDLDIFTDRVYCFTPSGDLINLPNGSTPIDFAYSIHSAIGNKMVGARINSKMVTIDHKIENGDRIEIITSQNSRGPSMDWLKIVKSTQAKNKISQWFKKELKEENIEKGKEMLERYCKVKGIPLSEIMKPEWLKLVMNKYGFKEVDAIYAAVGHGGMKEGQIINKLYEEYAKKNAIKTITDESVMESVNENKDRAHLKKSKNGIVVKGIHDVAVRFSRCCGPVPGDEIVGYVTRGRGVSIHRTDCINIIQMPEFERERLIDADWQVNDQEASSVYNAEIQVYCTDRVGLLVDITRVLTEEKITINSLNARKSKQGDVTLDLQIEIFGVAQLNKVSSKIRNIEGVIDIERSSS
ncbi:MAG: bifunctional (p)ppGpp synthetase/guanosine-3,5-bis(diphosphate) 3-pyrophosphohydrolase [Clostridiales bacterium]|jgi:GTP pyrophosphokinase|nr:bifunctional (p)ppGpp synthetase/guanosine-3,5-bis(diphosphate) 3-pyrophosphohydrolase [Clostridiales bacterium]